MKQEMKQEMRKRIEIKSRDENEEEGRDGDDVGYHTLPHSHTSHHSHIPA